MRALANSDSTSSDPTTPLSGAGVRVVGGYEIEGELGRGGMGVVYRAWQRNLNRVVALKMLSGYYGPAELKRFFAEAETTAGLHHTNMVHIYDVGEHEGAPFFAMEFVEGGSLADRLRAEMMPPRETARLLISVARALEFAHQNHVVHRDMKPANILLDRQGVPKVTDFGIAKRLTAESALTLSGAIIGTPVYMAPEQARGTSRDVGAAADIYSLGAILYEMLAGRPPFLPEESDTSINVRVITETPVSPAWHRPGIPRDLETICLKCLAKEPRERYLSAAALADDLQRFLDDQPIVGRRTSHFFRKAGRKLPAYLAVIALIALGIFLFPYVRTKLAKNPSSSADTTAPASTGKSIAVLPFENRSASEENAFFTDGVQDEIRTDLAKVADLKVISRTTVMQYKTTAARNLPEIAQSLKVTHILEGSVQRASNRVRVAVQLIDARADSQLWAEHYDRPLDDVFAIQSEIAKAIVEQLRARISPSEKAAIEKPPTTNIAAYDLYNRSKAFIATSSFGGRFVDDLSRAARLLDEAVALDPQFVVAYCELAGVHDYIYFYGADHTPARLALAGAALQSALKLEPNSTEAHLARAGHLFRGYFDYDGARTELAIVRRTLPNDPRVFELTGYIDRRQGRQKEGLENLERALELDPRNFGLLQQISLSYGAFRRYPETVSVLDRALAVVPADVGQDTKVARAQVNLDWQADTRPLHAVFEKIIAENPAAAAGSADNWLYLALCERDPTAAGRALTALGNNTFGPDAILFSPKFGEGLIARMQGNAAAAKAAFTAARAQQEEAIRSQGEYGPALCVLGVIDAGLGRKEDALREGRRAVELVPLEKDALNGVRVREFLAVIYGWTGEKALACQQLSTTLQLPASVSYGELRLHPYWDPLRGEACFEKIVTSLAPNDKDK
ncbi:MAG: eukaryotic-like serine/threonine-protein kinase [Verrucomicrobiota bacterium]|jgi:serine/threonine protein kinase/tetratricopeptide (TPR) repeat protein